MPVGTGPTVSRGEKRWQSQLGNPGRRECGFGGDECCLVLFLFYASSITLELVSRRLPEGLSSMLLMEPRRSFPSSSGFSIIVSYISVWFVIELFCFRFSFLS